MIRSLNTFTGYLENHIHGLRKELAAFLDVKEPESLHKIRVHIKKIRAASKFLNKAQKSDLHPGYLKPLFKKAGKLREVHIHSSMVSSLPSPQQAILRKLNNKIARKTENFMKEGGQFYQDIGLFAQLESIPARQPSEKVVLRYFRKKRSMLEEQINYADRKNLHLIRRELKRLLYVYDALPHLLRKKVDLDKKYIDKLQELTGSWHDTRATLNFLKKQSGAGPEVLKILKKQEREQLSDVMEFINPAKLVSQK